MSSTEFSRRVQIIKIGLIVFISLFIFSFFVSFFDLSNFILIPIKFIIQWILVPILFMGIIYLGYQSSLPNNEETIKQQLSKRNALYLSITIWLGVVILNTFSDSLQFKGIQDQSPPLFLFGIGIVIGFVLTALTHSTSSRFRWIFVVILTSGGAISLYYYLFFKPARDFMLFISSGLIVGVLIYSVIFSIPIKSLFNSNKDNV